MKKMLLLFFGTFTGNAILAPIGFMGPPPYWPGIGATILAVTSFVILVFLSAIDWRTRRDFIHALSRFRTACAVDEELQAKIDMLEDRVMKRDSLVSISHEIGFLHGELVEKGWMKPDAKEIRKDAAI